MVRSVLVAHQSDRKERIICQLYCNRLSLSALPDYGLHTLIRDGEKEFWGPIDGDGNGTSCRLASELVVEANLQGYFRWRVSATRQIVVQVDLGSVPLRWYKCKCIWVVVLIVCFDNGAAVGCDLIRDVPRRDHPVREVSFGDV